MGIYQDYNYLKKITFILNVKLTVYGTTASYLGPISQGPGEGLVSTVDAGTKFSQNFS